jgi:hypothetical protein
MRALCRVSVYQAQPVSVPLFLRPQRVTGVGYKGGSDTPPGKRLEKANWAYCNFAANTGDSEVVPGQFVKGEVKKKHPFNGRMFSCFSAHMFEQDLF